MNGLLVAGNFFVDRLNAQGQSTGIIGPINTTKLAIKADADEKVRGSRKKESYGQALSVVKIAKPAEVEWSFDDQPAELIAMDRDTALQAQQRVFQRLEHRVRQRLDGLNQRLDQAALRLARPAQGGGG